MRITGSFRIAPLGSALVLLPLLVSPAAAQRPGELDPPRFATATATVHATVQVLPAVEVGARDVPDIGAAEIVVRDVLVATLLATRGVPVHLSRRRCVEPDAGVADARPIPTSTETGPCVERIVIEVVVLL